MREQTPAEDSADPEHALKTEEQEDDPRNGPKLEEPQGPKKTLAHLGFLL
jgi:hypothetical protein